MHEAPRGKELVAPTPAGGRGGAVECRQTFEQATEKRIVFCPVLQDQAQQNEEVAGGTRLSNGNAYY